MKCPGGSSVMPFVQMFYGQPSAYLWQDDLGEAHTIHQGEGGEQGNHLMPLLFSLGQHSALEAVNSRLLMAFLDDVCVVNVQTVFCIRTQFWRKNCGPMRRYGSTGNRSGSQPRGCDILQNCNPIGPDAVVWRGSDVPTVQQGIKILGTLLGHHDNVRFMDMLFSVPSFLHCASGELFVAHCVPRQCAGFC